MDWKTSWSYLPINYNTNIGTVRNITQRTFMKNNLNGTKFKIRFSNLFSKKPIILEQVVLSKKNRMGLTIEGFITVTYKGNEKIIIGQGEEYYSDEIDLAVSSDDDIVLSIYVEEAMEIYSVCSTWAARSWNTIFGQNGNYTKEQEFEVVDSLDIFPLLKGDPNKSNLLFGISGIKVYAESDVKTIACFGDSITHMSYYTDALIEKLYKAYPGKITVINRGLGGNRLLNDYSHVPETEVPGGGTIFGAAGIDRFFHDIYHSDTPEFVVILIGINDFTHPYALKHYDETITIDEYKNGIQNLVEIAHNNGSKVLLGTITPFKYEVTDWYAQVEELRKCTNEWIREQSIADGVIDFDSAIRITNVPERMVENCHLGDGLHPNALGGELMAAAFRPEIFLKWNRILKTTSSSSN